MELTWYSTGPFVASNTTGTSVVVSGAINDSGIIYSVIVPAASGAPSVAQVIAGQDSASGALGAGFKDNEEVAASGTWASLSGYGLTSETDYKMYLAASGYTDGLMAAVSGVAFTTPDITAPAWVSTWPNVSSITTSTASINLKLDDAGSGYFVIIPSGNTTPSAAQIIAHTDSDDTAISTGLYGSGTLVANTEKTLSATNLRYSTYYTVCVTAKDDAGNPTATVATSSFRASVPAPGAPSNFYSAKNVAERKRKGMVRGTLSL